jgi:hypothetical protein
MNRTGEPGRATGQQETGGSSSLCVVIGVGAEALDPRIEADGDAGVKSLISAELRGDPRSDPRVVDQHGEVRRQRRAT